MRVNGSSPDPVGESVEVMPFSDAVHRRIRSLDVEVALEIPDDANRSHRVRPTEVQDLLDHLVGRLVRVVVGASPSPRKSGFAELSLSVSPQIERGPRDSEAPACRVDVAVLLRVLEDSPFAPYFSLIFGHLDPLGQPLSSWQGVRLNL